MAMTLLEKILASHSGSEKVVPGDIIDIEIDARAARDFGGANVVKNLRDYGLQVADPDRTLFTFDCNPTGSDQKYAVNQHICRIFARENNIRIYDIDAGIGTHILIEKGFVYPGATAVSTDSHANILGAIGAFGQGMGDMDIAAAWHSGKIWFKVPPSVRINFIGDVPGGISSKDIVLNMLGIYGANSLLGYSVEIYGRAADKLTLDERITISSMATEMGAIIILFPPSQEIIDYCSAHSAHKFTPVYADDNAVYEKTFDLDVSDFKLMISLPGKPHDAVAVSDVFGRKIDSAFIGSCTNGRMEDMRQVGMILKDRKIAPGVVLKIVPATNDIWMQCLEEGLIEIFKKAGALVSNAGCAGCAAGQVGQNGPGEVTVSTGNRNFPGKQGKGQVYLASPEVVAASAVAGFITTSSDIPTEPALFSRGNNKIPSGREPIVIKDHPEPPSVLNGRIWVIDRDNVDTDMIFHNRYLTITDINDMGRCTFDNLQGYEDFSKRAQKGDLIVAGKNFGSGSSRQQAVDCFVSLGIQAIIAESFGAIYERNAINAAFPVLTCKDIGEADLKTGDHLEVNLNTGEIKISGTGHVVHANPFSPVQYAIYRRGGLLGA